MSEGEGNRGVKDRTLTVLLLAVFCSFFAALLWNPQFDVFFGDPGVGWHLANGKRIAATGQIVVDDPFLTAARGERREWIYGQWLGDFLYQQLFALGGFKLLYVGSMLLCLLPMYLQTATVRSAPIVAAVLIPVLLLASAIQWLFRPVLWSFLFFSKL